MLILHMFSRHFMAKENWLSSTSIDFVKN